MCLSCFIDLVVEIRCDGSHFDKSYETTGILVFGTAHILQICHLANFALVISE